LAELQAPIEPVVGNDLTNPTIKKKIEELGM